MDSICNCSFTKRLRYCRLKHYNKLPVYLYAGSCDVEKIGIYI